jgi:hypothetical protein
MESRTEIDRTLLHHRILKLIIPALLACLWLLTIQPASAQRNAFHFTEAPKLRQSSLFTLVYAIPTDSVYELVYKNKALSPSSAWMQHPAFVIPADRYNAFDSVVWLRSTPAGYYLAVSAQQAQVQTRIIQKPAFRMYITDMERIKVLNIRDSVNREVKDISVRLRDKDLSYDNTMKAFVLDGYSEGDIVTVRRDNDISFLTCTNHENPYYERKHVIEQVPTGSLTDIWSPTSLCTSRTIR